MTQRFMRALVVTSQQAFSQPKMVADLRNMLVWTSVLIQLSDYSTSPSQTQYGKKVHGNSFSTIEFCYLSFESIEEKSYQKAETILDQAWKNRFVVVSHDRRLENELQDEQHSGVSLFCSQSILWLIEMFSFYPLFFWMFQMRCCDMIDRTTIIAITDLIIILNSGICLLLFRVFT